MYSPKIICSICKTPAAPLDWKCTACDNVLEIANAPRFDPDQINVNNWSLWRYAAMLPAEPHFTLGEGMTPLINFTYQDQHFFAKLDYLNPTGSYKDRGTAVLLNYLYAQGVRSVVETSSGNAGSSVAMFASGMGMRARVFTPAAAVGVKKRQIAMAGELVEVPGPRSAVDAACEQAAEAPGVAYATHAYNPLFIAGQMTGAWEIWEQLGRRAPEAVACPVGMGCLMLGLYRGFVALKDAELIDRVPRFYAVQAAWSDPIVQAWEQGLATVPVIQNKPSVADGILTLNPPRSGAILQALRDTQGGAFRVEESAILPTRDRLMKHGMLVEPTSAVTVAALPQIRQHYAGDDLVMILTGNGLKTINVV